MAKVVSLTKKEYGSALNFVTNFHKIFKVNI